MEYKDYPRWMVDFYELMYIEYKMPKALAEGCASSFTKEEMELIKRFLTHYGHLIELPYSRYSSRQ